MIICLGEGGWHLAQAVSELLLLNLRFRLILKVRFRFLRVIFVSQWLLVGYFVVAPAVLKGQILGDLTTASQLTRLVAFLLFVTDC